MSQIYPSSSSSLNTFGLTYGSTCEWNIKSDVVRSLSSGKLTEVLAILASDQTRKIEFFSRESDKKPKLEISYTYASVEASVWPSVIGQGQNVAINITTNPLQTQGTLTFQYSQDQIVWQNITSFSGGSKEYAWSPTMSGLTYLRVLWSISWASGSYSTSKTTTLNIDVVSPGLSIMAPGVNTTLKSSDVKVTWEGSDADSGIDHYELKADFSYRNDELVAEPYEWNSIATNASFTFRGVPDGDHIVYVKAVDKVGLSSERSVTFTVNTSILGGPGWTDDIIVFGSTATAIVVVGLGIFFLRRKRPGLPPPPP
jgi:hypothetical protein